MAPRVLSQTWRSAQLPSRAQAFAARWRRLNPNLALRLYDDAGARAVVADVAGPSLAIYDRLPFGVMRADIFRLAVLLRDGGLYADIDMQPLKPLPEALFSSPCTLMEEAHLGRQRQRELGYRQPIQIANCIMAGEPGHPFFRAALDMAFAQAEHCSAAIQRADIEDITGPRMITRLLQSKPWRDVQIAPQIQFMAPLDYPAFWPIGRYMVTRHEAHGTWKDPTRRSSLWRRWIERNRPVNPFRRPVWRSAAEDN